MVIKLRHSEAYEDIMKYYSDVSRKNHASSHGRFGDIHTMYRSKDTFVHFLGKSHVFYPQI